MQRTVLSWKYLPTRLPVWNTVILFLALDYWEANDTIRAVAITLLVIVWVVCLVGIFTERKVNATELMIADKFDGGKK